MRLSQVRIIMNILLMGSDIKWYLYPQERSALLRKDYYTLFFNNMTQETFPMEGVLTVRAD